MWTYTSFIARNAIIEIFIIFSLFLSLCRSFPLLFHSCLSFPSFFTLFCVSLILPFPSLLFPECVAKGSGFTFGGLEVDPCSRDLAFGVRNRPQPFATVRANRSQPFAHVRLRPSWPQSCRAYGKSRKSVTLWTCQKLCSCRFAWQAWHFVTFQHVSRRVQNRFVWQAQYLCYIFRRCVAFFVAGAALWTPPMSFCVACQRCAKWWQAANSVAGVAFCDISWKSMEASHETSILTWQLLRFMRKLVGKRRFFRY